MSGRYDDAIAELYRAPHDAFVAERKRLATELKAAGDKPGGARLLKLGRPTLSAWAVNQLWWQARDLFERLLAAAERLRAGDQAATAERRDAMAALKSRAAALLVDGGHAVNEATLRRVTTTLAALAATGGFEPDPPGALAADRDPPGFDAAGFGVAADAPASRLSPPAARAPGQPASPQAAKPLSSPVPVAKPPLPPTPTPASTASPIRIASAAVAPAPVAPPRAIEKPLSPEQRELEQVQKDRVERERAERARAEGERIERERAEREEAERRRAEQELRRLEVERVERRAERQRLLTSLPSLQSDLERRQREVERLHAELLRVEGLAEQARTAIELARKRLATLGESEDTG